jgi:2,4-dienoyl-CoA reductase-like NADH-dependent reductase (Old Yellow Enzyme family)
MTVQTLFHPFTVNTRTLKNRLVVAPMTRITANAQGVPGERMRDYYQSFARGGFSLIIAEGTWIDSKSSQTYEYQPGIIDDVQAAAWRSVTDAVHAEGGKIFIQLQHAGALSQGGYFHEENVAPSALQPRGKQLEFYRGSGPYTVPRALTENEIIGIIESFAEAAERAVNDAGFDGIEIHGANGYLLDQFLTDYTNQRTDRWGGDSARRLTLSIEVIRAVRERLGSKIPVGIRISQGKVNDFAHKWKQGIEDARVIFSLLADTGIDFLHLTEHAALAPAFADDSRSLVALARQFAPEITIIANGGLEDPTRAQQALTDGANLIALGRGALANHDWPERVRNGLSLNEFDPALLRPLADIKANEIV